MISSDPMSRSRGLMVDLDGPLFGFVAGRRLRTWLAAYLSMVPPRTLDAIALTVVPSVDAHNDRARRPSKCNSPGTRGYSDECGYSDEMIG